MYASYYKTGSAAASMRLTIAYSDGTPTTRMVVPIENSVGGHAIFQPVRLASTKVKKISVSAVLGAGTGTLNVDELYAWYQRNITTARSALPMPMPLPPAP